MRLRHWDRDYDEHPDACPLCAMYNLPPGARTLAGWEDHAHRSRESRCQRWEAVTSRRISFEIA